MKHVLLLTTGGTIASENTERGLFPERTGAEIAAGSLHGLTDCAIACRDILALDSSNIQPEEWQIIARETASAVGEYDGVVITHGTDTMAYTASALTYMLQNLPIPVVLTGSQLPFSLPLTDATDNIRCAVAMALSGRPGVFLAFDRKVMLGCRGVKVRTSGFDAFESINWPYAARVTGSGLEICEEALPPAPRGPFSLEEGLCTKVFLLKLTPGLDPGIFDLLLAGAYQGILIEAFGAGGLHYLHRDLYEKLEALRQKVTAEEILTPRVDVIAVEDDLSLDDVADTFAESGYSRLPVYHGTIDNIIGVVHEKDFYLGRLRKDTTLEDLVKPTLYTTGSTQISQLLRTLREQHHHMAVVVDEYGGTEGIITLEDILEELVGEIWDEHDEVTEDFRKQSDGSWIVLGSAGVDDLYERLGLPEDEDIDSNTVNGLVQEKTCRLPKVGDRFTLGSYDGVVTRTAKRRVTEVRLTPAAPAEDAEKDDEKDKRFSRLAQRGENR